MARRRKTGRKRPEYKPNGRIETVIETVIGMWRTVWTGAVVLLAASLPAAAGSDSIDAENAPRALASNGAVIIMPDLAGLDCTGMSQVLRRIDMSNYRGPDPVAEDHPDWPIFEYEDRLTGQFYFACTLGEHQLEDPGAAFSFGFESQ
jgi:hypothetical protein